MFTVQNYVRAQSLEEAWTLNQNKRNRILGGMMWLRLSGGAVGTAIDLCDLGLDGIEETEDAFVIGAMTPLRALETHEGLAAATNGAIRDAVKDIVGVQFRNMATLGGSLWGRYGFSDVLTVFLALGAQVELYKGGAVPLSRFVQMDKDRDVLVSVRVPKNRAAAYLAMRSQRTDFPVIAVAVARAGGVTRAAIGARPGRAMLVEDEAGLLAGGVTQESAKAFADFAASRVQTGSNVRGSAAYRSRLIRVLAERAVLSIGGEASWR